MSVFKKRLTWVFLLGTSGFAAFCSSQLPRYRAEETALVAIANIAGAPVKYVRIQGVSGFQFVDTIWLPQVALNVEDAKRISEQLEQLPRISTLIFDRNLHSDAVIDLIRDRHPEIFPGTFIGFSRKPVFRFAKPVADQPV